LHMAQLMPLPLTVSCSSKSRLVLPFWYRLTRAVPDKVQGAMVVVVVVSSCDQTIQPVEETHGIKSRCSVHTSITRLLIHNYQRITTAVMYCQSHTYVHSHIVYVHIQMLCLYGTTSSFNQANTDILICICTMS